MHDYNNIIIIIINARARRLGGTVAPGSGARARRPLGLRGFGGSGHGDTVVVYYM